ncbi:MAG TPA: CocE/NonD family hydrolase [Xanthobacteraceae bacterium]|nr:CocE/NonD family hydrolase [Xanthobacteraceae bacterium]
MGWQRFLLVVWLLGIWLALAGTVVASADGPFVLQQFRVPLGGDLGGLEALLVRPSEPGRYPLTLIAHGSPRPGLERPNITPLSMLPQALEFVRRGWAAVIVMRRGYGSSDGAWAETFGTCDNPNYIASGLAGAADLKMTLEFLSHRPDLDPTRMISVGVSAGGFVTAALTADPPPGLVAAISFAGGRGSLEDDHVCRPDRLIDAFGAFGKRSRVPMLWVYAANDHVFGPALAQQLKAAFASAGGSVDFISAPAFGTDGHTLFSPAGIPEWTPYVEAFLRQQNLTMRSTPLPLPLPAITAPKVLGANGQKAFAAFLIDAPHKAFALAPDGSFGWKAGVRTVDAARASALKFCQQNGTSCSVMFVDDAAVAR